MYVSRRAGRVDRTDDIPIPTYVHAAVVHTILFTYYHMMKGKGWMDGWMVDGYTRGIIGLKPTHPSPCN